MSVVTVPSLRGPAPRRSADATGARVHVLMAFSRRLGRVDADLDQLVLVDEAAPGQPAGLEADLLPETDPGPAIANPGIAGEKREAVRRLDLGRLCVVAGPGVERIERVALDQRPMQRGVDVRAAHEVEDVERAADRGDGAQLAVAEMDLLG